MGNALWPRRGEAFFGFGTFVSCTIMMRVWYGWVSCVSLWCADVGVNGGNVGSRPRVRGCGVLCLSHVVPF